MSILGSLLNVKSLRPYLHCHVINNNQVTRMLSVNSIKFKSKQKLDRSKVPVLNENDLEEQFVRGSGPGGQATNKTNNAVFLKHKSTGLIVKCHETRSLNMNRTRAREIMVMKLDNLLNGEDSLQSQERRREQMKIANKEQKRKKLEELKRAFKEREGLT